MDKATMKVILLVAGFLFLWSGKLVAAPATQLDPDGCVRAPDIYDSVGQIVVGKNWLHYKPYMKICAIRGANAQPDLFVYTLDLENPDVLLYKDGKPFDEMTEAGPPDEFPLPALIDSRGNLIGLLPVQIYSFPPQSVKITFTGWAGGFPSRVSFQIVDPTVSAPFSPYCPPPLIWRPAEHKYIEAKGDFFGVCPRHS